MNRKLLIVQDFNFAVPFRINMNFVQEDKFFRRTERNPGDFLRKDLQNLAEAYLTFLQLILESIQWQVKRPRRRRSLGMEINQQLAQERRLARLARPRQNLHFFPAQVFLNDGERMPAELGQSQRAPLPPRVPGVKPL